MNTRMDNERWIMSFYRNSEISGALFFGRIAAFVPPGTLQTDLTKHFSDESMHAWYWTKAMQDVDYKPIRVRNAYQDDYLEAAGLPVNIMEILALTNVFEKRVIKQYANHLRVPDLHPIIADTIRKIMEDEKWHIKWINQALRDLEKQHGKELIQKKLRHYEQADQEVYGRLVSENEERLAYILQPSIGDR